VRGGDARLKAYDTAVLQMYPYPRAAPRRHACMKLLLQTAAWHAHAGCACVYGGSRIDPDVNGRQKAFQRVHDGGAQGPSSSGSWWPLSAPLCLPRAILSISTISKAHRQLLRRSILDADGPNLGQKRAKSTFLNFFVIYAVVAAILNLVPCIWDAVPCIRDSVLTKF
jgi:hypothetical protein